MRTLATCLVLSVSAWAAPIVVSSPNAQTNDMFGFTVASIGDVNGDGVSEVVVAAPNESSSTLAGFGRAYVYRGSNGSLLRTLNSPTPMRNGAYGYAVAAMPDVDGDAIGEILVGAPAERVSGENIGRVHVHSGADGDAIRSFDGIDDGILTGRAFGYGSAIAVYGDANDDDVPDILVGAPGWSILSFEPGGGFLTPGRAYLIDGEDGARIREFVAPNPTEEGSFGDAVAVLDDFTGDGFPEVVIGAPTDREGQILPGRAYVFNGATGAQLYSLSSRDPVNSGRFGADVRVIEDLNGDGIRDIVVTADNEVRNDVEAVGRVYVFSGATGNRILTIESPDPDELMFFGTAVDAIADYSGDGLDDLVITAGTGMRLKQQGIPLRAFIVNSISGAIIHRITIQGSNGAPLFGSSVAGIGDMDNDGKEDVVLGSSFGQGGFAARAYIARSRDFAGTTPTPPPIDCHGGAGDGASPWIDLAAIAAVLGVLWRASHVRRTC